MRVNVVPCGEVVNESEAAAIDRIKRELQNVGIPPGWESGDEWVLLTNLAFSVTNQFQSDDIDIVVIGPPGVQVLEVKHWSVGWSDANPDIVQQESDKLTLKARRIGTTLRRVVPELPRVDGTILLTRQPSKVRKLVERGEVRGVPLLSLNQWKQAIGFEGPRVLTPEQVRSLAKVIEPKSAARLEGSLRRLAGYVNLEQLTSKEDRFHRVYRGSHPTRRDKVILHLYDLSATDEAKADVRARREAETLQRLQLYTWAPRILDSFQDAPGFAGEMYFFTIADPAAPMLKDRTDDDEWSPHARALFAREAIRALATLHNAGGADDALVHRNLTPYTILVRYDNTPLLTGFDRARIPSDVTLQPSGDWSWRNLAD